MAIPKFIFLSCHFHTDNEIKKKCTQTLQGSNKGENPNIKVKVGVISRINTER